ncbi:hypothetical protein SRHO_G00247820 [Serrasalmus rhombeus]
MEFQPPAAALTAVILMIICSTAEPDDVRLVGGSGRCDGAVEVLYNGHWRTFYGSYWIHPSCSVCMFGLCEACGWSWTLLWETGDRQKNTCTRGKPVGLTCSEVRLVNGSSRCAGTVEMFHYGDWRSVRELGWSRRKSTVVCRQLDCGSAVAAKQREPEGDENKQGVITFCDGSESAVSECRISNYSGPSSDVVSTCSDSVRLVDGAGRCSGRLEAQRTISLTVAPQPERRTPAQAAKLWDSPVQDPMM